MYINFESQPILSKNNPLLNAYFYSIEIRKFYLNNHLYNGSNIILVTKQNFTSGNKSKDSESE